MPFFRIWTNAEPTRKHTELTEKGTLIVTKTVRLDAANAKGARGEEAGIGCMCVQRSAPTVGYSEMMRLASGTTKTDFTAGEIQFSL